MADMNDFNTAIIEEFRANDGVVGGPFEGATLLLLSSTGAKTGSVRVTPVVYQRDGERLYIFASKAGAPTNPDWYHNLKANPTATIEVGAERYEVTATEITGEERDRIYAQQVELMPGFGDYEKQTDRVIPVVALDRTTD
jgi:deazaflavin-dependent oxidoreductase (nitroreductase family)